MSSFKEVEEIIKLLNLENLTEYAKNVDDALRGGSTGSEIWGGVRFSLLEIPSELLSATVKGKINALIKAIDNIMY